MNWEISRRKLSSLLLGDLILEVRYDVLEGENPRAQRSRLGRNLEPSLCSCKESTTRQSGHEVSYIAEQWMKSMD